MAAFDSPANSASLWLATFAALIAVIGWETDWGRRVSQAHEVPAAKAQPVTVALLPEFAIAGDAAARRETLERPAFVPTRRPAPPPPSPSTEPPKPKLQRGQFVLTGTAVVDNTAIAFLREASTGKARSVRKGDTINGMTVTEVVADRIVLALGEETEGLALKVAAGPRTTIQPPVPGQPPAAGQPKPPPGAPAAVSAPGRPQVPTPSGSSPPDATAQQSLLERRRAARAAQAAAEAAARAGNPAATAAPGAADSWGDVYRRMQQPRP